MIDLKSYKIKIHNNLKKFNFCSKNKTTYEDFSSAFSKAIIKRVKNLDKKIFIGLSSGHDSGLIAAELSG